MQLDPHHHPAAPGPLGSVGATGCDAVHAGRADERTIAHSRLRVVAEALDGSGPDGGNRPFTTVGQTARTLLALNDARPHGRTALEVSTWALRFAAYCHDLKRKHGLVIVTEREAHPGGWHGRHHLVTPVRIVSVETGRAAR